MTKNSCISIFFLILCSSAISHAQIIDEEIDSTFIRLFKKYNVECINTFKTYDFSNGRRIERYLLKSISFNPNENSIKVICSEGCYRKKTIRVYCNTGLVKKFIDYSNTDTTKVERESNMVYRKDGTIKNINMVYSDTIQIVDFTSTKIPLLLITFYYNRRPRQKYFNCLKFKLFPVFRWCLLSGQFNNLSSVFNVRHPSPLIEIDHPNRDTKRDKKGHIIERKFSYGIFHYEYNNAGFLEKVVDTNIYRTDTVYYQYNEKGLPTSKTTKFGLENSREILEFKYEFK